jgi:hypothetical protein
MTLAEGFGITTYIILLFGSIPSGPPPGTELINNTPSPLSQELGEGLGGGFT